MPKKYFNRGRWLKSELDGLYRLSIDRRVPVESLVNLSKKKRTFKAIGTKMWKVFGTSIRRGKDGLHYLYLEDEVPKIVRVRRTKVNAEPKIDGDEILERIQQLKLYKLDSYEKIQEFQNQIGIESGVIDGIEVMIQDHVAILDRVKN